MKGVRLFLVLGSAIVALAYFVFSSAPKPDNRATPSGDSSDDLVVGEPFVFRNLAIFPVSSKAPRDEDRFITLDEGLAAGTVEIFEKGAAPASGVPGEASAPPPADPFAAATVEPADPLALPATPELARANAVNELMVVNRSDRPLYVMPGEIIIGGSQDRTIAEEVVVAADHKPVVLGVYCVEHGRWGSRDAATYHSLLSRAGSVDDAADGFSANLSLIVSETTEKANAGRFMGSVGSLNKATRLAVHSGEGQQKVWEEVASENAKSETQLVTGTFASNYFEAHSADRLEPYLEQLLKPIDATEHIVGVIVAVNGEMGSMDVFESTPLFRKLWPKLLKSYALDASNAEGGEKEEKVAARSEALAFLHEVRQAHAGKVDTSGDMTLLQGKTERVLVFSAHERRNQDVGGPSFDGAGGGMMGGIGGGAFGGAIHSAGYSK